MAAAKEPFYEVLKRLKNHAAMLYIIAALRSKMRLMLGADIPTGQPSARCGYCRATTVWSTRDFSQILAVVGR